MNILFLQDHGGVGGAQKSLLDLLEGFRSAGSNVAPYVLLGEDGYLLEALKASGFAAEVIPFPEYRKVRDVLKRYSFPKRVSEVCATRQIHVVHGNTDQMAPWSALIAAKAGVPSCCTVRELVTERRLEKNRVLSNDGVIAISQAVKRRIPPRRPGQVRHVYNAIRPPDFLTKDRAVSALGLSHPGPRVVCLGQLAKRKSPETLLEAAPEVIAKAGDVEFVFIGGGDPEYEVKLRARAAELGLKHVQFMGERRDGPALLRAFDMLVLPAANEGLGRVTVEAMYAGLPVIASDSGATKEIVVPGITGQLFDVADAAALARAIVRYVKDPALRRAHGAAGHARARDLFDPSRNARRIVDVYERLVAD